MDDIKEVSFVQSTKGNDGGILKLLDALPRADGSLQRVSGLPLVGRSYGVAVGLRALL